MGRLVGKICDEICCGLSDCFPLEGYQAIGILVWSSATFMSPEPESLSMDALSINAQAKNEIHFT